MQERRHPAARTAPAARRTRAARRSHGNDSRLGRYRHARLYDLRSDRGGDFGIAVKSSEPWAHTFVVGPDKISFTVEPNPAEPGSEAREALLTFSYPKAESVEISIRQKAPDPKEPDPLTFVIEILRTTPSAVFTRCTPSDGEATYILRCMSRKEYESYADDAAVIAADIEAFERESWTGEPGRISDYLRTGTIEEEEFGVLVREPCYVYAYGLKEDGTTTSELFKAEFTVPERPVITVQQPELLPVEGGTFTVTYSVAHPSDGAVVEITPSPDDWVHDIRLEGGEITFVVDPNTSAQPGDEPRESHFNLSYPEAYNQFVGIRQAAPEEIPELTFAIEIRSLTVSEAVAECTPSDPEATYVLRRISRSEYEELGGDAQLIASDVEYFLKPDWLGNPGRIADHLVSGVREESFSLYDTEPQYIYAYGLTGEGTATSAVFKTGVTAPARPVIDASDPGMLPVEGGTFEVTYTVENPYPDELPTIETAWGLDWAHDFTVEAGKVSFIVDSNDSAEPGGAPRQSFFRIRYTDAYDKVITLRQLAPDLSE